jgi:regulatory associated protein of mTOR
MTFQEHKERILSTQIQRGENYDMISGCTAGDVRIWDIRSRKCIRVVEAVPQGVNMTALAIHEQAPLFAWYIHPICLFLGFCLSSSNFRMYGRISGTNTEYIRIFNAEGSNLSTIRYNDGFLGPRIGHVGCLSFHPLKHLLAAGTTDNASLSLFASEVF